MIAILSHAMAMQVLEHAMGDVDEIWGSEVALYVPQMYAGTTDLVGQYKGQPCIMDFKQTNKPKKLDDFDNFSLQLLSYVAANNAINGTHILEGHIFMCSRGDDGMELGGETYQQFDVWPDEYDEWRHEWYNRVYTYYEKFA